MLKIARISLIAALALALGAGQLYGQKNRWGFEAYGGYTQMTGDYGDVLEDGVAAEGNGFFHTGAFRFGLGVNVVSLNVKEPIEIESWAQVDLHAFASYFLPLRSKLRPYVQGRVGLIRFTPEDHRVETPIEDLLPGEEEEEEGENLSPRVSGASFGGLLGLEYAVSPRVGLDLSGLYTYIKTEKVENLPETADPPDTGGSWSVRFGVKWSI